MNRKQFIKNAGLGILALPNFPVRSAENPNLLSDKLNPNANALESWSAIRDRFPLKKNFHYLNNGTMGINPQYVLDALNEGFRELAMSGHYPTDAEVLRKPLSRILGVSDPSNIAITKNVTEGISIACFGQYLKSGDEVIMTTHEHIGGCASWLYRAAKDGIVLKTFSLAMTAEETFENLKKAVTKKTRVIAIPHIPCTIGQILPVQNICAWAREKGIITILDGAHPLGMLRLSIDDIQPDFYAGCLHKWLLGPIGLGFLYIRKEHIDRTKIFNLGAYSLAEFDMTASSPRLNESQLVPDARRYSTGTFSGPLYIGGAAAIEWYESIGAERIEKRVKELSLYTQTRLRELKEYVSVLSPIEDSSRGAQTTFSFKSKDSKLFTSFLGDNSKKSIQVRHVHEGKMNAIRISTHYYNFEYEIDLLIEYIISYAKS